MSAYHSSKSSSSGESISGFLGVLRRLAPFAVVIGGLASMPFLLYMGRHNKSILLLVLFTIWILAPFGFTLLTHFISKRWSIATQATLHVVMLVLTLGTLTVYVRDFFRPRSAQPAFVFVAVPMASWFLILVVCPLAAFIAGKLAARTVVS